jgi:hypothetical protein
MGILSDITVDHFAKLFAPAAGRRAARLFVYPGDSHWTGQISAGWKADLFAIVSDTTTAEGLRKDAPTANVVRAALRDVRVSHGSMNVAVIELPAPSPDADDPWDPDGNGSPDGVLRRATLAPAPAGLLVAAIPLATLRVKLWRTLTTWFDLLWVVRLVDRGETTGVIVVGRLRDGYGPSQAPALPDPDTLPLFTTLKVPLAPLAPAPKGDVQFLATGLTWTQALAEGRQRGAWSDATVTARLAPDAVWDVRPLMPLARGHLGQLIACGAFNNALLQGPEGPVLLKGQTHKIRAETENSTEHAAKGEPAKHLITMRDAFRTNVTLLHLQTGEIQSVQSDETDGDSDHA